MSESSIPIPKIFHSDLTDSPLENCVTCDRNLLHGHEPYVIEKAFRYYPEYDIHNTIFEYIMCIPCAQKMNASMSEESLQKIQTYFGELDMKARSEKMKEGIHISHIVAELEKTSSEHDLWAIRLGNSMETPSPINNKKDFLLLL